MSIELNPDALKAAKFRWGDAVSWGVEPEDAIASAIVGYLEALAKPSHDTLDTNGMAITHFEGDAK